jgi:CsoR family transcriptional regulator, copper-sensing transcriptional repressor
MASYVHHKDALQARLRRIEGQVRGLQKMIEEEKYCVDVLTQVSSVLAALQGVGVIILEDHIKGCVRNALAEEQEGERAIEELIAVVERFVKVGPTASTDRARGWLEGDFHQEA